MTIDKPDPEDDPNASVVDYELMAYSNIKIDYEYVINLIQNIVTPENSDEDITSEERQKKIEEIRQYIEELRKENPKIADIMADVVYEIEQEVRKIQIDWQIVVKFSELVKGLPEERPIFVGEDLTLIFRFYQKRQSPHCVTLLFLKRYMRKEFTGL